ncbi:MAG: HAMP domain-containing sensor histidine kinase, partial [Desulfobacteraceae bacterium]|jgi:signal transduction histidine kinase
VFTALFLLLITIPSQRRQLLEEMRQRAQVAYTSTAQVAVESIVLEDYSAIVEHCINMVSQNPGLKYVVLTREDGFSLVHTHTLWQQNQLNGLWRPETGKGDMGGRFVEHDLSDGRAFHLSYPLVYSGIEWGWIHLGLSPEKFYKDLRGLYLRALMAALLAAGGGLIASFLYARKLSVPIQRLDQFARKIADGDLFQRIDIQTGDEVQSLADSFNHMVEELHRSNQELVKTARQAGMAEMAVDVLHNVGNVLNSVGVTTQELKRRVGLSKMASLKPVVDLLENQGDNLPDFIANDTRGQKLPKYLSALSAHFDEDHKAISAGLDDLERYIQHIQDIVRLQQSYSRTIGLTECVNISEVIEDAIALNIDGVERHGIHIVRDMEPLPGVVLDRHKLLQILTNLISNAKQAFQHGDAAYKQIQIKLYRPHPKTLCIAVSDSGMGIAEENLTRIFQHGFTTRNDGHGFGLHSSAIAATEMDGSLNAESSGPGLGATFTLELPIRFLESEYDSK